MTSSPATESALLPCPFCDAQMRVREHSAFHPVNDCWLATAGEHGTYELDESDYPAWNRRPPVASPDGRGDMNNGLAAGAAPLLSTAEASPAAHPVFAFLLGSGPLNNYWFGETPPPGPKNKRKQPYWWREHLRHALAKIATPASPPTSAWRDIASAPKDGTRILLGRPETEDSAETVAEGYYWEAEPDGPDWMGHDGGFLDLGLQSFDLPRSFGNPTHRRDGIQPTHWMPLPLPPGDEK
ncbi:MAG: hypothetical protein JNL61_11425 [Rhizobiaceae bacterium]|nr:hypothetical protein [Rhizobiaceae bacterium]